MLTCPTQDVAWLRRSSVRGFLTSGGHRAIDITQMHDAELHTLLALVDSIGLLAHRTVRDFSK